MASLATGYYTDQVNIASEVQFLSNLVTGVGAFSWGRIVHALGPKWMNGTGSSVGKKANTTRHFVQTQTKHTKLKRIYGLRSKPDGMI